MNLQPQLLVDSLVQQHKTTLARLHADLRLAVLEVTTRWADKYPDPSKLRGQTRCVSVRDTLLDMYDNRRPVPGATMTVSEGPGQSVVFRDREGRRIRVRKYPNDRLRHSARVVRTPPLGQREVAEEVIQMALDEGMEQPVLPARSTNLSFDLFVLWWLDDSQHGCGGADLAAVVGIDDSSQVRILASAPLPAPTPIVTSTESQSDQAVLGDFEEFDAGAAETGDDTA